jgi:hypothetical protein
MYFPGSHFQGGTESDPTELDATLRAYARFMFEDGFLSNEARRGTRNPVRGRQLAGSSRDLAKHLGISLAKLSGREDLKRPVFKDGILIVAGRGVQSSPVSEQSTTMDSRFIEAARFEVRIDSTLRPEMLFGAIGIGESRQDVSRPPSMSGINRSGPPSSVRSRIRQPGSPPIRSQPIQASWASEVSFPRARGSMARTRCTGAFWRR